MRLQGKEQKQMRRRRFSVLRKEAGKRRKEAKTN